MNDMVVSLDPKIRGASIEVEQVTKTYPASGSGGPFNALDGASFSVSASEFACILGPSGCGKSTLLNILSGLDEQYEGSVRIHDRSLREQLTDGFRVGYVFQEPRLMPWRTVRENIAFALAGSGLPASQWPARIDRCLALVELDEFGGFYPLQLSGGMQQRASIARAFAIEPDILLMDEPFSSLDELTARRLRQQLLTIWAKYRSTVVFVTHNAFEATFLGDRIMMMTRGPRGKFCGEINLNFLPRPRSYEDVRVFDASRQVIQRLFDQIGTTDENSTLIPGARA
jgi:NitT/TauT family transport system ATP-binding protein